MTAQHAPEVEHPHEAAHRRRVIAEGRRQARLELQGPPWRLSPEHVAYWQGRLDQLDALDLTDQVTA